MTLQNSAPGQANSGAGMASHPNKFHMFTAAVQQYTGFAVVLV